MKNNNLIALTSRIAENAHKLIVQELALRGITGIVPSHGGILGNLFSGEPFTMKELADRISRSKPTVTILVDKLVELGYVTKEKRGADGRVTYIKLTEQGLALQPVVEEVSQRVNAVVYQNLSESEIACAEAVLAKVRRNFDQCQ